MAEMTDEEFDRIKAQALKNIEALRKRAEDRENGQARRDPRG